MRQITSGGAADAIGRLFHHHRGLLENIAHDRGDVGMIMMARMTPAARIPIQKPGRQTARRRTGWSTGRCRPAPEVSRKQRGENKQAPHAVHDARDCRQQLNRNAQRTLEPRGQFCQKQRDAEAHRNGDQQRDKRGDRGSVNRDQRRRSR